MPHSITKGGITFVCDEDGKVVAGDPVQLAKDGAEDSEVKQVRKGNNDRLPPTKWQEEAAKLLLRECTYLGSSVHPSQGHKLEVAASLADDLLL